MVDPWLPCCAGGNVPAAGGSVNLNPSRTLLTMRLPVFFRLLFFAAAFGAAEVSAQSIPSPYRHIENKAAAGPMVGYVSTGTGRFGYGPKGGLFVGGRWGIELAGPVSFEVTTTLLPTERDVVNPGRDEGDRVVGTADALMATLDGRLKFSFVGARHWHRQSPFLVFGGGIAFDLAPAQPDDELLEAEDRFEFGTSFYGTAGVGNRFFVSERLTLRAEGLFQLWQLDTPPGFASPERGFAGVQESEWVDGFRLSVSAVIRW